MMPSLVKYVGEVSGELLCGAGDVVPGLSIM